MEKTPEIFSNRIQVELMYTLMKAAVSKNRLAKLFWCIKHDLILLLGRILNQLKKPT